MKISYVLPVYNEQTSIAICLDSLLKQKITPHEIIIMDDASTDNSLRVIEHYVKKNKMISVYKSDKRRGAAVSRNLGNIVASGDVIAVCDAEYYPKTRSQAISEFFTQFPDKDLFHSGVSIRNSVSGEIEYYQSALDWDFNSKCPCSHPTIAYTKKVAKDIRYPERSIDTDLYEFFLLKANKKGYKMGGADNSLCVKTEGNSNRDKSKAWELKRKMYKKWGIEI